MFLDFDGVLNNESFLRHQRNHPLPSGPRLFDPENIAALNRLCSDLPVASIVVSSSWRTDRDLDELRLLLSQEGFNAPGLLDAATGHVADDAEGRALEVAAYVKEMDLEDWFALDDFNLQPYLDVRVPPVHGARGLTSEFVTEIVSTLHNTPAIQRAPELERTACKQLRAFLEEVDPEIELGISSNEAALLTSLEWYLGELLAGSRRDTRRERRSLLRAYRSPRNSNRGGYFAYGQPYVQDRPIHDRGGGQ